MPLTLPLDAFMAPTVDPEPPYVAETAVVCFRRVAPGHVFLEVLRRGGMTYGFRYRAWVAWRDAGNAVRSHSWVYVEANESLITDSESTARLTAQHHAQVNRLHLVSEWVEVAREPE